MYSAVEEFVRYQIANAPINPYPFPHFYVRPVFPEDYYREVLAHLPRTEVLKPIHEYGTSGKLDKESGQLLEAEPRLIADLAMLEEDEEARGAGNLWRDLSAWLLSDEFRDLLVQKFDAGVRMRFGQVARLVTDVDGRFVRDFTQYLIHPHTDQPGKLVSLLFYLPSDESLRHQGTAMFRPIDPKLRCPGPARHAFELFKKVATMPFLPNALFGFFKTDYSFHGVEEIKDERIERNVLLYNIYVKKVVTAAKPAAATARWSWPFKGA
jgi:hypothetical protein